MWVMLPSQTQTHYVTDLKDTLQIWRETAVLLRAKQSAPQKYKGGARQGVKKNEKAI